MDISTLKDFAERNKRRLSDRGVTLAFSEGRVLVLCEDQEAFPLSPNEIDQITGKILEEGLSHKRTGTFLSVYKEIAEIIEKKRPIFYSSSIEEKIKDFDGPVKSKNNGLSFAIPAYELKSGGDNLSVTLDLNKIKPVANMNAFDPSSSAVIEYHDLQDFSSEDTYDVSERSFFTLHLPKELVNSKKLPNWYYLIYDSVEREFDRVTTI